jgi:hypothetical protein
MLFSLVGCQQDNNVYPPTFFPSAVIPTNTITPIPSQTATITAVPTITVTASPRPTSTITLTPLPTIPKDKILAKLDQLYLYNNGCKLPCWWGIKPGITTWSDARNFLMQFDAANSNEPNSNGASTIEENHTQPLTKNPSRFTHAIFRYFPSPGFNQPFGTAVEFEIQNGVVVAIKLRGDISTKMFNLKKLYKGYGNPDRILVVPKDCSQPCWADMFYMYDEEGFMSQSYAYINEINSANASLCIFAGNSGEITTWAPGISIDLKVFNANNPKFLPIDQATQEQISELFMKSTNPNGRELCFDVPINLWK